MGTLLTNLIPLLNEHVDKFRGRFRGSDLVSEDDRLPAARLAVVDLADGVPEKHELGSPIPADPEMTKDDIKI